MMNGMTKGMPCEYKSPHMLPNIAQLVTFASRCTILPYITLSHEPILARKANLSVFPACDMSFPFFRLEQHPIKMSVHIPVQNKLVCICLDLKAQLSTLLWLLLNCDVVGEIVYSSSVAVTTTHGR